MKPLLLCLLCAPSLLRAAEPTALIEPTLGSLTITQFVSAPYPHPSRADGHKYKEEMFPAAKHYSDSSVGIFIPKNFHSTGRVDVVVHFHGWRNNVTNVFKQFQLAEQLVESGRNAVLVVPQGPRDAADSSDGKLEDADGFKKFIGELTSFLQRERVAGDAPVTMGNIILSAHSGGYKVTAAIVDRGGVSERVREVWLFDALYGGTENFLAWSDKYGGRFVDIYTDNGGTKENSEKMLAALKERKASSLLATEDSKISNAELRTNKLVFLHTDMTHNDVVAKRKTFCEFLKTSCLGN